jgi:tyrosine-protein phosphatase YwqE
MFSFFKSKTVVPEIDFSSLGTDIHSHLVPGIDDGAQNLQQSIELIKSLVDLGFKKIITTPHIMVDYYRNDYNTISTGLNLVKTELNRQKISVKIEAAAEYYFDEDFENKLHNSQLLNLGKYLLFEISFSNYPINLYEIIQKITDKGFTPILAHPERYTYLHGSINNYHRIKASGCNLQLNTLSLGGYYGKHVKRMAEALVDGSDMHHQKHADALRLALSQPYLYRLLTDYPLKNATL